MSYVHGATLEAQAEIMRARGQVREAIENRELRAQLEEEKNVGRYWHQMYLGARASLERLYREKKETAA